MPNENERDKVRAQVSAIHGRLAPGVVAWADVGGHSQVLEFVARADTEKETRREALKLAQIWLAEAQEAVSEALALEYQDEQATDDQ